MSCDGENKPVRKELFIDRVSNRVYNMFDIPVTWFRENIVVRNQKPSKWYHQKFQKVASIDTCYTDDRLCIYEADVEFKRAMRVEADIVSIMRLRLNDCIIEEKPDTEPICRRLKEEYELAAAAWFTKYGDLGATANVQTAFMKQKHRLLWERRHGPVGTGMKKDKYDPDYNE